MIWPGPARSKLKVAWLGGALLAATLLSGCELISLGYLQSGKDGGDFLDTGVDATHARDGKADVTRPREGGADATLTRDSGVDARHVRDSGVDATDAEGGGEDAPHKDGGVDAGLPYLVWYHFDGNTNDSSGHGYNGTLNGDANVNATGVRGKALSCHAMYDSLTLPDAGVFMPGTSSFSIAMFFKLNLAPDGGLTMGTNQGANTFFWKGSAWNDSADPNSGVSLGYWSAGPHYLIGDVNDNGANADYIFVGFPVSYGPQTLANGEFHHTAFVVDRDAGTINLYADGKSTGVASLQESDGGPYGSLNSSFIGTLCAEQDPRWTLDGYIDEFMIVSKALSTLEVQELASFGRDD